MKIKTYLLFVSGVIAPLASILGITYMYITFKSRGFIVPGENWWLNGAIVVLMVFIFVEIVFYFISNKIVRPIKKLEQDIEDITKGDLSIKLEKSNMHEIQSLTDSLDRILISLKLAVKKTGIKLEEIGLGEAVEAKKRAETLAKKRTGELIRFSKLAEGREEKMIELKKRVKGLETELSKRGRK